MKRGRKSAAELTVIAGNFGRQQDDSPPDGLNARQAEIWRSVIASEARGLFSSSVLGGLLADYCRHRESSEVLSTIIGSFNLELVKGGDGVRHYKSLIQMRELETRATTSLATKLRLTNQSRYTPQAAATTARNAQPKIKRPWE